MLRAQPASSRTSGAVAHGEAISLEVVTSQQIPPAPGWRARGRGGTASAPRAALVRAG